MQAVSPRIQLRTTRLLKFMTKHKVRQRKAIAQDVIAQIKARRYTAESMVYVGSDLTSTIDDAAPDANLQTLLKKEITKAKPCRVCGLGACFISAVRLYNDAPVSTLHSDTNCGSFPTKKLRRTLLRFFTLREQGLIEASFETDDRFIGAEKDEADCTTTELNTRAELNAASGYKSALDSLDDENRLIFLMGAVFNLADKRLTLAGLREQLIIGLATFKPLADHRSELGL